MGTIDSWDVLKKAFIQRYCPPSKTAKQLDEIRNFKQEGDETLYQAWERNINSSSNIKGIDAIVSKLDNIGRDMKKLKENVHAIQVGCQTCEGTHLDKECPLNEEVKSMEEVKYGEFSRPFPNISRNDGRFNRGVSG
ncbi:putative reverse transcriptase domain-containing protein [Tanacetum coccineum]